MVVVALTLMAYAAAMVYAAAVVGCLWLPMAVVDDLIHLMAKK